MFCSNGCLHWVTFTVQPALSDCGSFSPKRHWLSPFVLCLCEVGVKEQRRVCKWKGFPELWSIKVTDGFINFLPFSFISEPVAIKLYLSTQPLVPSIATSHGRHKEQVWSIWLIIHLTLFPHLLTGWHIFSGLLKIKDPQREQTTISHVNLVSLLPYF